MLVEWLSSPCWTPCHLCGGIAFQSLVDAMTSVWRRLPGDLAKFKLHSWRGAVRCPSPGSYSPQERASGAKPRAPTRGMRWKLSILAVDGQVTASGMAHPQSAWHAFPSSTLMPHWQRAPTYPALPAGWVGHLKLREAGDSGGGGGGANN